MVRGAAESVQGGPFLQTQAHPRGPGQPFNLMEPMPPGPLGHNDLFQGGVGLAQGGQDGMASVDDVGHIAISY